MCESFKRHNKGIDTLVMVTRDVSNKLKERLAKTFDKVIVVNYTFCSTIYPNKRTLDRYVGWINYSFTKWKCLLFEEYDKVLFIDADSIILDNIEEIFKLKTPAGCFFNTHGKNKIYPDGSLYDPYYPANMANGNTISKKMIESGYKKGYSFVEDASFVLLKPSKEKYNEMISLHRKNNYFIYPTNVKSGPDEFIMTKLYDDWTSISPAYDFRWKFTEFKWDVKPKVFNFIGAEKPWAVSPDKYKDLHLWWDEANKIKDIKDFIVPKKNFEKAIVYFHDKNLSKSDKKKWNSENFVVVLISFKEGLPHKIYEMFDVVCKMKKEDEITSALLLTQFKEVYLFEHNMMRIEPDLQRFINGKK